MRIEQRGKAFNVNLTKVEVCFLGVDRAMKRTEKKICQRLLDTNKEMFFLENTVVIC